MKMYLQKVSKKLYIKIIFVCILKVTDEKSKIRRGIRVNTKMSRIRNTGLQMSINVGRKLMIFALIDDFDAYIISTSVKTKDTVSFVGAAATVHLAMPASQNGASHYCVLCISEQSTFGGCEKRSYQSHIHCYCICTVT
jgi:hypothetical protein